MKINQPKDQNYGDVELDWDPTFSIRKEKDFKQAQKVIDENVLRLCRKFIPFDRGTLATSGDIHTIIGSGTVRYKTPYARRLYYGVGFTFQGAPVRGAYWFERMKASSKQEILEKASEEFK